MIKAAAEKEVRLAAHVDARLRRRKFNTEERFSAHVDARLCDEESSTQLNYSRLCIITHCEKYLTVVQISQTPDVLRSAMSLLS